MKNNKTFSNYSETVVVDSPVVYYAVLWSNCRILGYHRPNVVYYRPNVVYYRPNVVYRCPIVI